MLSYSGTFLTYPKAYYTTDPKQVDSPEAKKITAFTSSRGIEIQETCEVIVTDMAQLFEWKGYGLKLNIPPQSLPSEMDSCTITIKVSLSGQYQFPTNTELVSPVFWLQCSPSCVFKNSITLEIQHCAPLKNSFRLLIARASCTQEDLPYTFKVLHGGVFNEHSSYGSVALSRFSSYAVIQEMCKEHRYWSSVFYLGPLSPQKIHFAVTWDDDAHITVSCLLTVIMIL